jgi:hypothetical protein
MLRMCVAYNFYSLYINLYFTATPLHYESGEVTEDIEVCEEYDDIWSSDSDGVPDLDFLKNTSTRSGRVIKCKKYSQYI